MGHIGAYYDECMAHRIFNAVPQPGLLVTTAVIVLRVVFKSTDPKQATL